MESAVASVLNNVLGEWLENLNAEQLNLSIWSGSIRLGPIKVRPDAFDKFGLPFQIRYGYVRSISVDVDWMRLSSKPLVINIEDVYVYLCTRPSADWSEESELRNQQSKTASDLANFEAISSEAFAAASEPGFVDKLVTKIVDNVQVKIERIYVRLEDDAASIEPYAIGVVLGKVQAVTCNAEWKPMFVEQSPITYKLAQVENLSAFLDSGKSALIASIYPGEPLSQAFESLAKSELQQTRNHQFILSPSGSELKLVLRKDTENFTRPQLDASLVIGSGDALQLGVQTPQLTHVLKLAEFYSAYSTFKAGVLSQALVKRWDKREAEEYRLLYKDWCRNKADTKKATAFTDALKAMEQGHLYEEIVGLRAFVLKEMRMEQKEAEVKGKIEEHKAAPSGVMSGFKGMLGWGESKADAEARQKKLAQAQSELVQVQQTKRKLQEEFSAGQLEPVVQQAEPEGYTKIVSQVVMPRFILHVGNGKKDLLALEQQRLSVVLHLKPTTITLKVKIGSIVVRDEVAKSAVFPNIVQAGHLSFAFEQFPGNRTGITLNADRLFAVANILCFLELQEALHYSIATQFDLEHYRKAAGERVAEIVSEGRKFMEDMLKSGSRQEVTIKVEMWAPCAVVPLDIREAKNCIVADFGMITIGTSLARPQSEASGPEDEKLIYDFYNIAVTEAKTGILWEFQTLEQWRSGRFSPLFQPSTLSINIGKILNRDLAKFPYLLVTVAMNELTFYLADTQLLFLLKLKRRIIEQIEDGMVKKGLLRGNSTEEPAEAVPPEANVPTTALFSAHIDVSLRKISLLVEQGGKELLDASVSGISTLVSVSESSAFLLDFRLQDITLRDCREGVVFPLVLSRPIAGNPATFELVDDEQFWYHNRKVCAGGKLTTADQIALRLKTAAGDETVEVLVSVENLRTILSCDLADELIRLPLDALQSASEASMKRASSKELSPLRLLSRGLSHRMRAAPPETQVVTVSRVILATVVVEEVELWVPESSFNPSAKILSAYFDCTLRYTSSRVEVQHKTRKGAIVSSEVTDIDDEASIDITKMGIRCGYLRDDRIAKMMEEKDDIMQPSRLAVDYTCVKGDGPTVTTIEASSEAIVLEVGFRDIVHLRALAAAWIQLQAKLQSAETRPTLQRTVSHLDSETLRQASKPLQSDEIHVRAKLSSLEVTVVDDTEQRLVRLFFADLMNVSAGLLFSEDIMSSSFSSGVKLNYFNTLAACWEPLVEEWVVEFEAKQPDPRTPVEVLVRSSSFLNVNLSYQMGTTVSRVLNKLQETTEQWAQESPSITPNASFVAGDQVVYRLKNRLGTGIRAWIDGGEPGKAEVWSIPAGKSQRFGQQQIDRVRLGDNAAGRWKYASLMLTAQAASAIAIEVETIGVVKGITVDDLVTRSIPVGGEQGKEKITIVVDISVKNGERVISVESLTKILNNSLVPVELMHRGRRVEILAGRAFSVPLSWTGSDSNPVTLTTRTAPVDIFAAPGIIEINEGMKLAVDSVLVMSGVVDQEVVKVPHQKVIVLNTPFTVHNLTPGMLSLYYENELEPACTLGPGEVKPLMGGDATKTTNHKWVVQLDRNTRLETELAKSAKELHHVKVFGDFPADKLTVEFMPMSFVKSANFDLSFKPLAEETWNGVVAQVYFPFFIVNRTPYALDFSTKHGPLTIPKQSVGTVKDTKSQMTVRTSVQEFGVASEWSKPFNMRTVGIAGSLQLNSNGAGPSIVHLGVKLENAPWPFIKTVIVKVQPRFVMSNYLDFAVFVRQAGATKIVELPSGESIPYQLENAKAGRGVEISRDMENWSSPFSMEDIDDLQVRFKNKYAENSDSLPPMPMEQQPPVSFTAWFHPSSNNNFFHFVRVNVSTEDEATLFVTFTNPIDPEFVISNMTDREISACQVDCHVVTRVGSRSRAHFAFDNHLASTKKVRLQYAEHTDVYAIDNLRTSKRLLGGHRVRIVAEGVTRVVFVEPDTDEAEHNQSLERSSYVIGPQFRFNNFKVKVQFTGCVVSLIDDQPCERFVFSLTGLDVKMYQTIEQKALTIKVSQGVRVHVKNMQLDDMQAKGPHFPVILGQHMVVLEPGEELVPFFQFRMEKTSTRAIDDDNEHAGSVEHFQHVGLLMQPVQLQVHQETILGLLGVTMRLQEAFIHKHDLWKGDSSQPVDYLQVCPSLKPSYPALPARASQISSKAYFQFVNLNAMKFIVSYRSSSKKTTLKIDPRQAFGVVSVLSTVGRSFINISDSPLMFTNIILLHSFQTIQAMTWTIAKNYIRQGALQFYKIIGSSDMIGNPIGLIDKLGTGVFEFFNEPRKGLLKGPKEFATGLGKGVKSLVSGVVSGGFGSVSRITGSLYSVVREVGGDENSYERINRNDTATQGIYHGFKGGLQDLAEGVSGLFTKPFRGAKAAGVKGFFKGMGSGLIGAATAPLSAVLRVGTSVTSGIANSASLLRSGKIQQKGRIRFPRPLGARKVLEPYNEEIAQAQEFLKTLKTHMDEQLVFYLRVDPRTIVLITTASALEIVDGDVTAAVRLQDIEVCQVHWVKKGFVLLVVSAGNRLAVRAKDFQGLARLFGVFTMNSGKIDHKKEIPHLVKVRSERDRCCC